MGLLPVYKKIGRLLVSKHKVERAAPKGGRISYPTRPTLIMSTGSQLGKAIFQRMDGGMRMEGSSKRPSESQETNSYGLRKRAKIK